jgi:hypothetical protein
MTDDDIVGIRMTTPGDIKAFARAIEKKVRAEMNIVTINNKHYNLNAIVKIHDRQVYFNDGKSETFTEPEIQELFRWLFNEPRPDISAETDKVLGINRAIKETREDLGIAKPKKAVKKCKTNCGDYACDTGCKK